MRIISTLAIALTLMFAVDTETEIPAATTNFTPILGQPASANAKLESNDVRDKRALNDFNAYANLYHSQNAQLAAIQRRIANYGVYPGVQSNRQALESVGSNFIGSFANDPYNQPPQQYEAPEPIIEIIIKESNESLPAHSQPLLASPPSKKKKEEVQVFYVKYNKDEKTGLQIDDPIPALSPPSLNQEDESSDAEEEQHIPFVPTIPPITKSTTLRTIIKPDSEVFHSNSGIHVTFNTEDKHQSGHELQENIEESAVQPVISSDHYENYIRQPTAHFQPSEQQLQQHQQIHQQQVGHGSRTFDALNQFNRLQNQNRIAPQNGPSGIYRPSPDQGLLLSYTNNQHNRYFQSQNYDARLKNSPPVPFFPEPAVNQAPHHSSGGKYRSQPKPIPIPLRHGDQETKKSAPHPQQQYYSNPQQQFIRPGPVIQYQQPPFRQKPPPFQTFQSSLPGPIQLNRPLQPSHEQHRFAPTSNFQQSSFAPSNGLFSQKAPNHVQQQPNVVQQSNAVQQTSIAQQSNHLQALGPQFNRLVTGAELVESLPKFEQHITETVPLSEINKPFGRAPQNQQQPQPGPLFNPYQQTQSLPQPQPSQPAQQLPQQHRIQQVTPIIQHQQAQQQQVQHQQAQQQQVQHQQVQQQQVQHQQVQQQQVQHHQVQQQLVQHHPNQHQQIQQHQNQNQRPIAQESIQQSLSSRPLQHNQPQQNRPQEQHHSSQHQTSSVLIQQSHQPQIVLPINYHSQNPFVQRQQYSTNTYPTAPKSNVQPLQDKIIPGKGVSTLATDVFASLEKAQNTYKAQASKYGDTSSRNNIESTIGPIKSLVSSKAEHITITAETPRPTTTTAKPTTNKMTVQLPDEVPDDLRQQLLSSGILDNADISILDYDKVGDVPLESLPPEHLANFYGAGGAAQISSSNRVLNIVKPNGDNVANIQYDDGDKSDERKIKTLPKKHNVDLKVVRFDSNNQKEVANEYIKDDSQIIPSVDINRPYNRYLPLKIAGEHFPIPDVESLRNKKISSVVVLAPVDNSQADDDSENGEIEDGRFERDIISSKEVKFISGDALKSLLRKPTKEHYKKWLEKEAKNDIDLQSVVLLVSTNKSNHQEIFMYDIATQTVNRLKGELSNAFVDVAEANASAQENDNVPVTLTDSGIFEQMDTSSAETGGSTIPTPSIMSFLPEQPIVAKERTDVNVDDSQTAESNLDQKISISSGYSVIKR